MHVAAFAFGAFVLFGVLLDTFQTIILPRRPVGRFRITRLFFLVTWTPWSALTKRWPKAKGREQSFSTYGPLSLIFLFALWAFLLLTAYALLFYGLHLPFLDPIHPGQRFGGFRSCLYLSGTTLFTLGLGDVQPASHAARVLMVLEAANGLGFIALVIGYLPVLYSSFSTREIAVALLDARAGSPPTAAELLVRHNFSGGHEALNELLVEWERWSAMMLETHISYPILCYYRSQHDNQSWLSALTAVLDTCSLLITTVEGPASRQAQLTFAIGRHVLVDLGHVFHREGREQQIREVGCSRLPDDEFARLCDLLSDAGFALCSGIDSRKRLDALRKLYEPHAQGMAEYLCLSLPLWAAPPPPAGKRDQWKMVADLRSPAAAADRLTLHVSAQSSATRLQDREDH